MNYEKLHRLLILYFVALYFGFTILGGQPYGKVDSIEQNITRLENSIKELNVQQRLTSIEVEQREMKTDLEKNTAWQDKFQWALIVLLGESVWRLWDQYKSKEKK